jgi:hypothetical protein
MRLAGQIADEDARELRAQWKVFRRPAWHTSALPAYSTCRPCASTYRGN